MLEILYIMKKGIGHKLFLFNIICIIIFAILNYVIHKYLMYKNEQSHNKKISLLDSFYYSIVNQTTIGYGDITPIHVLSKLLIIIQCLTILSSIYVI